MRGIIMHDNGRLKTGPVSLLFFLCLILGLGLLFRLHKPVDKAVVVVRHIFAATPEAETKKTPLKEPKQPSPQSQQEPVKFAEDSPVRKVKEVKDKSKVSSVNPTPAQFQPEKSEPPDKKGNQTTIKVAEESLKKPIETKLTTPEPLPEPLAEITTKQTEAGEPQVMTEVAEKEKIEDKMSVQAKIEPEELVADFQQAWSPSVEEEKPAVSLMSEAVRQRLQRDLSRNGSPEVPTESKDFTAVSMVSNKRIESEKKPEKRMEGSELKLAIETTGTDKQIETRSITVEKHEYTTLHQAWRAVGEGEKENDRLIPLRIENLRSAYNFLQMKAVAILADNSCLDLSDGSRIPAASLNRFSSTVMRVDDPWQKWEVELRRAGLRPGQSFEVRYYLYDFVKRSIYARVNQAYSWTLDKGLVKAGTRPADVDVLGRAYVVKRSGGGSFGVFVPLSLTTRDGQIIDVDPLCFNNAPDIAALHAAGVI